MSIDQDRSCRCMFVFADGRRCQMPPSADDMDLCYYHAKKHRDHLNAQEAGLQINEFLGRDILTACDFNAALVTLFSAGGTSLNPESDSGVAYPFEVGRVGPLFAFLSALRVQSTPTARTCRSISKTFPARRSHSKSQKFCRFSQNSAFVSRWWVFPGGTGIPGCAAMDRPQPGEILANYKLFP